MNKYTAGISIIFIGIMVSFACTFLHDYLRGTMWVSNVMRDLITWMMMWILSIGITATGVVILIEKDK